jgi:small conductance mechanosensitive channel
MNFKEWYDKGYGWLIEAIPNILIAIVVLIAGIWFIKLLKKWLDKILNRRKVNPSIRPFLLGLTATIMQILLVLAVMQILGIRMTIFAAVIGAIGVAFGLALSGTLQNFTGGILILFFKPFRVGETIIAQGQEGVVSSIQLFHTTVISLDNKTVIIPNSKLSNEVITNISRQGMRRLDIEMKFNFGVDPEQVKKVILDSIAKSNKVSDKPPMKMGITIIDADGYKLGTFIWIKAQDFEEIKFELLQKIIQDLRASGIKLPGT